MFLLLFTGLVYVESVCDSMLLSLSSAGICEDGYCRTKEVANSRIELGQGHSVCFRIDQHQFNLVDKTVNLTILGSWISYPVSNCYLSDDPQVTFEGYCACSLSSPVDCQNCPINFNAAGTEVCIDGVNRGTGCFGFRTASHCVKASFEGGNRYKVCSIGKPKVEVLYKFFDTDEYTTGLIDIQDGVTVKSDQAKITFHSIDELPKLDKQVVIDLLNPFRIYLVPNKDINAFDQFDPSLPGWYRQNKTISKKSKGLISVTVPDCEEDQFIFSSGHATFNYFLSTHPEYAIETQLPGGLFSDSDAEMTQIQQVIYDPPLPALLQGAYFIISDGTIVPMGIDASYEPTLSGSHVYNGTIDTNWGTFNGLEFMCTDNFTMSSQQTSSNYDIYLVSFCTRHNDDAVKQYIWGICTTHIHNPDPGPPVYETACDHSIPFKAVMWPDNIKGEWVLHTNVTWHGASFRGVGEWSEQFNRTSDHIISDNFDIKADLIVEFSNITISFEVTNVQPSIVKIDHDDDQILVWAESTSVKGNCLLMVSDDIAPTRNIELTLAVNKYKLDVTVHKFKGDVVITIQCYKNKDSAKFYVEVDKGDVDIHDDTIKPDNLRRMEKEASAWEKANKGASKFWTFISTNLSVLYNLTGNAITDVIVGIILNILLFVLMFIVIWLLYKLVVRLVGMAMARVNRYRKNKTARSDGLFSYYKTS